MTAALRIGGVVKDVTGLALRTGGALKQMTSAWVRVGGALKPFYSLFTLSLSVTEVQGFVASNHPSAGTTKPVTVEVEGAVGTLTYLWARTDANPETWIITDPGKATTHFQCTLGADDTATATFACTVTDQAGQSATSDDVTATVDNLYIGVL